ncbi:sigma-54-dependent Fis family transcriptional regulator [Grimontia hollisae]|uniref:Putative repressor protein luxO n=1 Tax=Grimontia hollisae CIP 101886 TaxID=675812 RepID=D0I6Z2_GRIHO|nr:quorum-sensing sigma-54 dependent transcriptional regulator LuxO [Grimontia hollisae]AMG31413.1 sigma-54-dependent Fis family transcriptional regulator [Grimontia hollisae]EEY72411.1 putative repressor protein luxO [Grimontia hollisae CIP 101886]MDF2185777.1 sigma-54 dependent transcriptional regulator [Grimontia hollisae]STO45691.1 Luminescence regulatory protein luxO [Grimontia hollisae]STQ76505.1 Luminescence regulatory protein luxO [Grimontia hollisae]
MLDSGAKKRILMVEDTASVAALYKSYLNPLDVEVEIASTGQEAIQRFSTGSTFSLILLDLRLPDISGFDVLSDIRQHHPNIPVVIMTAHGSIDAAVEAMRYGASDFLIKPCEADLLRVTVNNALKPKSKIGNQLPEGAYYGFIGRSVPMQAVYRVIDSAAPSKATVFITGESGTGKEVCAEAVHAASSRAKKPFVAINCAAIPKDLIESELFGHVKGAFTGAASEREGAAELADGGTLFLDEICEMDLELQSKLLRFIQTGTFQKVGSSKVKHVDVRFVCATNRDPWEEVLKGNFREDLYYRLHVIPLALPPLRERGEDVVEIAQSLLLMFAMEEGKDFRTFNPEVTHRLLSYEWPGNVRQLQNVIRNIVVLHNGREVEEHMLPPPLNAVSGVKIASIPERATSHAATAPFRDNHFSVAKEMLNQRAVTKADIEPLWLVEKRAIQIAIDACDGNIPQAAGLLEVSPSTIYRKLQSWQESQEKRN